MTELQPLYHVTEPTCSLNVISELIVPTEVRLRCNTSFYTMLRGHRTFSLPGLLSQSSISGFSHMIHTTSLPPHRLAAPFPHVNPTSLLTSRMKTQNSITSALRFSWEGSLDVQHVPNQFISYIPLATPYTYDPHRDSLRSLSASPHTTCLKSLNCKSCNLTTCLTCTLPLSPYHFPCQSLASVAVRVNRHRFKPYAQRRFSTVTRAWLSLFVS